MKDTNSAEQAVTSWMMLDKRLLGVLAIAAISLVFQIMLSGYEGGKRATTPDTEKYLTLAAEIQSALHGVDALDGDVLRTPGYPVLIMIAAESTGVKLTEVQLPTRNWEQTNTEGKKLVRRIIVLQAFLGFLIPLIVYMIVLNLGGSVLLSSIVSLCYFTDISSVAFQFVVLNDTLSIFMMFLTLLTFSYLLKRRGIGPIAVCGIVTGLMILVRPPLAVLPAMLCLAAFIILRYEGASLRRSAVGITLYVAVVAVFPLAWSFVNFHGTGHFFFTKNATITLQNFSARRFVDLDIEDTELQIFQKHVTRQLNLARAANLHDSEAYAFTHAFEGVTEELAIEDPMYLYSLASRANMVTIKNHPAAFLFGGTRRWGKTWVGSFGNVKNRYAINRISELGLPGILAGSHGYLLFGPVTLFLFLMLTPVAAAKMSIQTRILFLSMGAFVLAYSIATAFADENEAIRHTMHIRVLVNGMLIGATSIVLKNSVYWQRVFSKK